MKKIVLFFLTILSISAGLALDTDTHKYIVFVSKHQNVEGLKANGYSKKSQPSEQMQFVITKNSDTVIQELVFKDQAEQALQNLKSVLDEAGAALTQVIKTTVYLSDISDWDELDAVYGAFFGTTRPSRSVVPTGPLHFGFRIEIEAIALAGAATA